MVKLFKTDKLPFLAVLLDTFHICLGVG